MKAVDELAKRFEPSIGKPPVCMTSREALVGREEGLRETATRPECSTSLASRQRDDGQLHRRKRMAPDGRISVPIAFVECNSMAGLHRSLDRLSDRN